MTEIDWEQFEKDMRERMRIEDTHAWTYRCFPPGPTTCALCGANKSDPWLGECMAFRARVHLEETDV